MDSLFCVLTGAIGTPCLDLFRKSESHDAGERGAAKQASAAFRSFAESIRI